MEAIEGKKEEVIDEIAEMEKELASLDPDTGEAKMIKRLLTHARGMQTRLTTAEGQLKTTQESTASIKTGQEEKDSQALFAKAEKVLNTTLSVLCDTEKEGGLKFDSDEAKGLWRQLVLSHLKDNPKDYKGEKDFVQAIQEAGRKYHSTLQKHGEGLIAKYLKDKKTPIPPAGGPGGGKPPEKITFENLEEGLTKLFEEVESSKK